MTTIRIYFDEDATRRNLVAALRTRGVDVQTPRDSSLRTRPDEEHLAYAANAGRVLYSFNIRDFIILHTDYLAQGKHHAGIILGPQQRYSIGEQMRRLLRIVAEKSAEDIRDKVEFLSARG